MVGVSPRPTAARVSGFTDVPWWSTKLTLMLMIGLLGTVRKLLQKGKSGKICIPRYVWTFSKQTIGEPCGI